MSLLVIAGPTGSGKSALAVQKALQLGGEIVSADSQQVYRDFDIGTAKPTAEQLRTVPHHLISVVDPRHPFSAARYQVLADAAIADIETRGKTAIVVGGTGLYLRVLLHGVVPAPPGDPALRATLEAEATSSGRAALHERLRAIDPLTASTVKATDLVRIIRALEIHALTGKSASDHRAEHAFSQRRHAFEMFVLYPPRAELYEAINLRTRQMFERGLVEETRALLDRGFRHAGPMSSVGYVQALAVVDGAMSVDEAIAATAQQTRHYAKRQWTWFRREQGARFIEPPYEPLHSWVPAPC